MSKKGTLLETLKLKPSEVADAIRAITKTKRAPFIWGPPGISKSKTVEQIATEMGIAFIDFRLSQLDPTDLRGIPYPTTVGGVEGVRWSKPYALPVDLNLDFVVVVPHETEHFVEISNPIGSNGIHYVTDPRITLTSITSGVEARIVDRFVTDDEGELLYFNEFGDSSLSSSLGEPRVLKNLDGVMVGLFDEATGAPAAGKVRVKVRGKARALLGLEEFNSAPPSVQAAAYQFVLDRRLGEYIVPNGVYILAMGNRDTDKGITYKMAAPIMNRFVHLEMIHDFDDWLAWAVNAAVHPEVVGYLSAFKGKLFVFEPGSAARGFETPRSWEYVSDIIKANPDMKDATARGLIFGAIGDGTGFEFMEHRRVAKDLPDADDVLSGKLKKMGRDVDIALEFALTTTLCYELRERFNKIKRIPNYMKSKEMDEWYAQGNNFMQFIMDNFRPEIGIMASRTAVVYHELPFTMKKMPAFTQFSSRHRGSVMQ